MYRHMTLLRSGASYVYSLRCFLLAIECIKLKDSVVIATLEKDLRGLQVTLILLVQFQYKVYYLIK